jgi:FkbM family methyltransferase
VKILWHSVAPWVGTGYGMQTGQAARRIAAAGHDLAISAYYGVLGEIRTWHGITCYPSYNEPYGKDTIVPHALHHFGGRPDDKIGDIARRGLVITLGDVWTFAQPLLSDLNVAAWAPIDHETVPPLVEGWFRSTGAIPIAMSQFGQRKLAELGFDPLYVPHAYEPTIFNPGDRAAARERCGLPADAFVVAIVAANVGQDAARKAWYEQILAFTELRRRHPDAVLAIHTDVASRQGVDIPALLADLPPTSYVISDQYAYRVGVPATAVADVYRAADVLSNTSWGEGFGVPLIEAQACGTPVIVTDTTAMPELCGSGWTVAGEPFWHDSQKAWARRPLIGAIIDAYEHAYHEAREEIARGAAWAFAQDYAADRVFTEYWEPALKTLAEACERRAADAARPPSAGTLTTRIREADGFAWIERGNRTDDWIGWSHHEDTLAPVMAGLLPEGGVFLDVGAHIGRWSLRMSRRASMVYAVEPNPDTLATLRRHLVINEIDNVSIIPAAAWDCAATLVLRDDNRRHAGGSTRTVDPLALPVAADDEPLVAQVSVEATRLDDVAELAALARLDLVKIDVEGSDLRALRGMAGLLDRHRPALIVERHDIYGYYQLDQLTDLLTGLGYHWREVMYATAPYLVCTPDHDRRSGTVEG